jgi:signal transduction histidine kinase
MEDNLEKKRDLALLSWIQYAPYGIFTLDTSLRVQSWNQWMEAHSTLSGAQIKGRSLFDIFPELVKRKLELPFQRALKGESSLLSASLHHHLLSFKSPMSGDENGLMRQTARVSPLIFEGEICGVIGVIEDVTQREHQAASLMEQYRRDEALSWSLFHLLKAEEPRKTVRQLFFKIAELLDFDTFFLYLREVGSGRVKLYEAGGITDDLLEQFVDYEPLSKMADAEEPAFLNSIKNSQDPDYSLLKEARISSAIVIPLRVNQKSLGSFCFGSWNRDQIAPGELELLSTVAQYLAMALDKDNTNRELEESFRREKVVREMAEAAGRAKDDFLAVLSHELRTPLNPVLLIASDSAEDDELPPAVRAQFKTILQNVEVEARLIDDLLDMTRINNGKLNLRMETVNAHAVLREAIRTIQVDIAAKGIRLSTNLAPEQIMVSADPVRLQQIFWNVLKNAVKFTPEGGKISIETFLTTGRDRINIAITDTGIGMNSEELERIFSAFSQGDHNQENSSRFGGLGLGLAISRKLVEFHSGHISATSNGRNQGSTFSIELPLARNSQIEIARTAGK